MGTSQGTVRSGYMKIPVKHYAHNQTKLPFLMVAVSKQELPQNNSLNMYFKFINC